MQVYERVAGPMEARGAGIVVQGELIDLLRAHRRGCLADDALRSASLSQS